MDARVTLNAKHRAITFGDNAACLDTLSLCAAMCCRGWKVHLTPEEYQSGRYTADRLCQLTNKMCEAQVATCRHLEFALRRNAEDACVYLGADCRCSIYQDRPQVCRTFTCQGGWALTQVRPLASQPAQPGPSAPTLEDFLARVTDDCIFVPHPLIKLHTVFYLKPKQEVVFVKQLVGACEKFTTRDHFDHPALDDHSVQSLIELFNAKESLVALRGRFARQSGIELAPREFLEIVWLLNRHSLVLDSRNFAGMLSGVGAI